MILDLLIAKIIKTGISDILANNTYKLRPTQRDAFRALIHCTDEQLMHGYFKLPTGIGKTIMFALLSKVYLDGTKYMPKKILVLVPRLSLIQQTQDKFASFVNIKASEFSGRVKNTKHDVIISTYQSLQKLMGLLNKDDIGIIFADEAHHILGDQTAKLLTQLIQDIPTIGFTATPDYDANRKIGKILKNEIFSSTLSECVNKGELCPVKNVFYRSAIICNLSDAAKTTKGDYDYDNLKISTDTLVTEVAKIYIDGADNGQKFLTRKTIINCPNIEIAKQQANKINELMGRNVAVAIYSDMKNFTEIQNKFKKGEFAVACQVGTMVEGYDDQEVSLCINYPTCSRVKAEQCAGRVLRINDKDAHKTAIIVDIMFKKYATEPLVSVLETATNAKQVLFYNIAGKCVLGDFDKHTRMSYNTIDDIDDNNQDNWKKLGNYGYILTDAVQLMELTSVEQKRINILNKDDNWKTFGELAGAFLQGHKMKIAADIKRLYNISSEEEKQGVLEIRKSGTLLPLCANINTLDELIKLAKNYGIELKLKDTNIQRKTAGWKSAFESAGTILIGNFSKVREKIQRLYDLCPEDQRRDILEIRKSGNSAVVHININKLDELLKLAESYNIRLKLKDVNLQEKTENWKSTFETAGIYFIGTAIAVHKKLQRLYDLCLESERRDILEIRKSGNKSALCVNIRKINDLSQLAIMKNVEIKIQPQNVQEKTDNWENVNDLSGRVFVGTYVKVRDNLQHLYDLCSYEERQNLLELRKHKNRIGLYVNMNELNGLVQLARQNNIDLKKKSDVFSMAAYRLQNMRKNNNIIQDTQNKSGDEKI